MSVWPAAFPPPAINTLNESPPNNVLRTGMDKGPPKTRRRTTANIRPLSFTLKLSEALVEVMDDFFVNDTFSGSIPFDYTHPRTGQPCTAMFATEPQYGEMEGVLYNVQVQLEIQP